MFTAPISALDTSLDASARLVLLAIHAEARHAFSADPTLAETDLVITQQAIANRAGVSRASVVRALPKLIAAKHVRLGQVIVGA